MPISSDLLRILVCPVTKGKLKYDANTEELISDEAGLAYPIRDGIPIMLPDHARRIKVNNKTSNTKPEVE
jgi:uncharacterized protein